MYVRHTGFIFRNELKYMSVFLEIAHTTYSQQFELVPGGPPHVPTLLRKHTVSTNSHYNYYTKDSFSIVMLASLSSPFGGHKVVVICRGPFSLT